MKAPSLENGTLNSVEFQFLRVSLPVFPQNCSFAKTPCDLVAEVNDHQIIVLPILNLDDKSSLTPVYMYIQKQRINIQQQNYYNVR